MHHEDNAIRSEAIDVASQDGRIIPTASYAMLQDRVAGFDRTIRRCETNMPRG